MSSIGSIQSILCVCISTCTVFVLAQKPPLPLLKEIKMSNNKNVQKQSDIQPARPQKPKPPYPYYDKEVQYENKADGITISGTLTLPKQGGTFPVVLLIAGMGPLDRNATMLGHEPFWVLADHLTRNGIAVLRVDKRGVGKSAGTFDATVTSEDLARDVIAGVEYLKTRNEINSHQIGLIGHSEGGIIASRVTASRDDIAFLVLLAGVATTSIENVIKQVAMQLRADGATEDMIAQDSTVRRQLLSTIVQETDPQVAESKMRAIIASYFSTLSQARKEESERLVFTIKKSKADEQISFFNSPSYRYWMNYNPVPALENITVPVLAINGDLDFIVSSKIALPIISKALRDANNTDVTILELPKLNHWFQTCASGSMQEYGMLEETISPSVLQTISDWILG